MASSTGQRHMMWPPTYRSIPLVPLHTKNSAIADLTAGACNDCHCCVLRHEFSDYCKRAAPGCSSDCYILIPASRLLDYATAVLTDEQAEFFKSLADDTARDAYELRLIALDHVKL